MRYISFDRIAEDYDRTRWIPSNLSDGFINRLSQEVPLGSRILEIGVGTGRLAIPLSHLDYEVLGVDISMLMLNIARQKTKKNEKILHLLQADATHLPIKEKTLDLCLFVHILHLIRDWKKAIDIGERLLRNHSIVNASLFVAWHDLKPFRVYWDGIESKRSEHIGAKNAEEVIRYMKDSKGYLWKRYEFTRNAGTTSWKDAIGVIQEKSFSSQWRIPDDQHQTALELVKENETSFKRQIFQLEARCVIDLFKMAPND
ncbi:MAG: class I SAM-dependent methyltransferase [Candidatus Heimdallarchaeota archaeon]